MISKNNLTYILALLTLCLMEPQMVMASSENGSITIDFSTEYHENGVSGATFSIMKVLNQDSGNYTVCEGVNTSVEAVIREPEETAKTLSAEFDPTAHTCITTGADGKVLFDGLSDGVYLVVETERTGDAKEYEIAAPMLVQFPIWNGEEITHDITVYPKTSIEWELPEGYMKDISPTPVITEETEETQIITPEPASGSSITPSGKNSGTSSGSGGGYSGPNSYGGGTATESVSTGDSTKTACYICLAITAMMIIAAMSMKRNPQK